MATIGKADVASQVAAAASLKKAAAVRAVDAVLATVQEALSRGNEVRLTGFGSFKVTRTAARTGRNPRTGQRMQIPAGKRPSFSAGSKLTAAVKSSR